MTNSVKIVDYIGQGAAADRPATPLVASTVLAFYYANDTDILSFYDSNAAVWVDIPSVIGTLNFVIDGGGSAITTGVKIDLGPWDYAFDLEAVTLLADQSGSIVIDLWSDAYANYPPTVADTITASAKPTLSSAANSQDATLAGWTKSIPKGNTIRINVDSAATLTRVGVALKYKRTS